MKEATRVSLKRLEDLRGQEVRRIDEKMELISAYQDKIAVSEAARLDAIRTVDTNAVTLANEKTVAQAAVLAKQLTETTDSLRRLIMESLEKQSKSIEEMASRIYTRMEALDKIQTASGGKSSITVPLLMLLSSLGGGLIVFIIQNLMR